jgi:hypothetical protein
LNKSLYSFVILILLVFGSCATAKLTPPRAEILEAALADFRPEPQKMSFTGESPLGWLYETNTAKLTVDPEDLIGLGALGPEAITVELTSLRDLLATAAMGMRTMARTRSGELTPLISSGMWKVDISTEEGAPLSLAQGGVMDLSVLILDDAGVESFFWDGEA